MPRSSRSVAVPLLAAAGLLVVAAAPVQAWWSCPSGYTLQSQNSPSRVRCYRAPTTETVTASCPAGTTRVVDQATQDRCYANLPGGGFGAYGPPVCPPVGGYTLSPVANAADRCVRTIGSSELAPNVNVN